MERPNASLPLDPRITEHIHRTARRLSTSRAIHGMDEQDIRQDLFLDLWRRSGAFDPSRSSFPTFADRIIAHRVATLASRKRSTAVERYLVSIDAPDGDSGLALGETLPDRSSPSELDLGLMLDVRRFVAGLPAALQRCCLVLMSPNVTKAAQDQRVNRSSCYENRQRLRQLATAAGLGDYLAVPDNSAARAVYEQHARARDLAHPAPHSASPSDPARRGRSVADVGAHAGAVARQSTRATISETGQPYCLPSDRHRDLRAEPAARQHTLKNWARVP